MERERGLRGGGGGGGGRKWKRERVDYFLDFNVSSTAQGHLRTRGEAGGREREVRPILRRRNKKRGKKRQRQIFTKEWERWGERGGGGGEESVWKEKSDR